MQVWTPVHKAVQESQVSLKSVQERAHLLLIVLSDITLTGAYREAVYDVLTVRNAVVRSAYCAVDLYLRTFFYVCVYTAVPCDKNHIIIAN